MNLLIALRAARGWVSRSTLMQAIDGYAGLDDVAFDRKFSRDKELLRNMGITIATRSEHDSYGSEGEAGYRISVDDYAMEPVHLSPAEAAAVSAAAQFWRDTDLSASVDQALTKLRALGTELRPDRLGPAAGRASSQLGTAVFATALHHINAREAITFTYHKPGSAPRRVRLEPYALLSRGDRVYLLGHDLDREAGRTFRLSRITGRIGRIAGRESGDYEIPADFSPQVALTASTEMAVVAEARLRVAAHRADPLRRRRIGEEPSDQAGADIITIEFADPAQLAAEIVGYGDAVEVLAPDELARAVAARRASIRDSLARLGGRDVLSA